MESTIDISSISEKKLYYTGILIVLEYSCKDAHFALLGHQEVSSVSHILLVHSDREFKDNVYNTISVIMYQVLMTIRMI